MVTPNYYYYYVPTRDDASVYYIFYAICFMLYASCFMLQHGALYTLYRITTLMLCADGVYIMNHPLLIYTYINISTLICVYVGMPRHNTCMHMHMHVLCTLVMQRWCYLVP